jgi:predicted NUDIX family NTP pyrophosphohydrolase
VATRSAGLVVHRTGPGGALEVLVVHPGGPFWARRDEGAWSIPKGEIVGDEDALAVARREFTEELGAPAPDGPAVELGEIRQRGGKVVVAWAVEDTGFDPADLVSNEFETEWPPRSGRRRTFPEVDRALWADVATARRKLNAAQVELVDRLLAVRTDLSP